MRVEFLPAAADELQAAADWFEARKSGLGEEFRTEVRHTVELIKMFPHGWHRLSDLVRRCQTNRFPYGVIYQFRESEDLILIVAIMHLHRRPGYWDSRIG